MLSTLLKSHFQVPTAAVPTITVTRDDRPLGSVFEGNYAINSPSVTVAITFDRPVAAFDCVPGAACGLNVSSATARAVSYVHPKPPPQQLMVTRFAASLPTDICPQPKEAQPLPHALTSD
jgi:hypothetical protein